ncbi:subtilisin-like serine protease-like protein [Apiospora arundinis]
MKISSVFCALFAVARVGAKATADAAAPAPAPTTGDSADWVHGSYIVELKNDESLASFYNALSSEDGIKTEERMKMGSSNIFNGASFKVLDAAGHDSLKLLDLIRAKSAVKSVWPVRTVTLDAGKTEEPPKTSAPSSGSQKRQESHADNADEPWMADSYMPHLMTQIDRLHAMNITGKGFKIAMMDSGVDYKHPALGGCFGPGCLVEGGYDFPDNDPYDDCFGHGTHVAGTIAAQAAGNKYGFSGAAPGAKLWSYRCWNCAGVGSNEILLASFIKAFEDGADIIQCSNGKYDVAGWADEPWALVASRIAQTGVPVIVSGGNSGGRGMFNPSTPASGLGVESVAAVQNKNDPIFVSSGAYTTDEGQNKTKEHVYGFFAGTPYPAKALTLPLWSVGNDTESTTDACKPLPDDTPDLSDKLVLIRVVPDARASNCYPLDQGANIRAKGGKYIAYYAYSNTTWDEQFVYTEGLEGVISVAPHQGAAWIEMLGRGVQVNVSIPDKASTKEILVELEDHETGGYAADFTSWGPNWELEPKPQVASPGGRILNTYPVKMGSYRVMSGTSMACPLVAGVIALMGEARGGKLDSKLFGRILSTTSKPLPWFDGKTASRELLAPVQQVGSGIVQAYDAVFAKTLFDVQSLRLNDSDHFVAEHSFTIENAGAEAATYEIGHMRALSMYAKIATNAGDVLAGYPNPTVDAWAELTFTPDVVTVPAGGKAQVAVTVVPPQGVNATRLPVYSGYVSINSTREERLVLPYLGVVGSMRSAPIITASGSFLANYGAPADAGTKYTLPTPDPAFEPGTEDNGRLPNFLLTPIMGTRLLHVHVVAVEGNNNNNNNTMKTPTGVACMGALAGWPKRYLASIGQRAYFLGMLADGTVLPPGSYKMVASALRIFGDEAVVGDWDVIETVPFSVQYANGTTLPTTK